MKRDREDHCPDTNSDPHTSESKSASNNSFPYDKKNQYYTNTINTNNVGSNDKNSIILDDIYEYYKNMKVTEENDILDNTKKNDGEEKISKKTLIATQSSDGKNITNNFTTNFIKEKSPTEKELPRPKKKRRKRLINDEDNNYNNKITPINDNYMG
jgi:hypothetical protein